MKFLIIFLISGILFINTSAQTSKQKPLPIITYTNVAKVDSGVMTQGIIIDGDTFPHIKMYRIIVYPERKFKNKRQRRHYNRLVHNVKVVYPYAVKIGEIYRETELELQNIPTEAERRRFIRKKEKKLKKEYYDALVNLTITQGRILIKLVDRQTGHTTFEVIQELKGDMNAYFWQSVALLFGDNLKSEYNPTEDDKMIEEIIAQIENGLI